MSDINNPVPYTLGCLGLLGVAMGVLGDVLALLRLEERHFWSSTLSGLASGPRDIFLDIGLTGFACGMIAAALGLFIWNLGGLRFRTGAAIEEIRQQSADDVQLLTGLVRSIQSDTDWYRTLEKCGVDVCQKLGAEQFLVLLHDAERGGYNVVFRKVLLSRKRLPQAWPSLDEVDWQMLESRESAIAINDLTNDLKLLAWRENLELLDVQSLLACNVVPGNAPEGIVMVASQSPRQWTPAEAQLLQKIAQQIGLILRQWQLHRQTDEQEGLPHPEVAAAVEASQETSGPDHDDTRQQKRERVFAVGERQQEGQRGRDPEVRQDRADVRETHPDVDACPHHSNQPMCTILEHRHMVISTHAGVLDSRFRARWGRRGTVICPLQQLGCSQLLNQQFSVGTRVVG